MKYCSIKRITDLLIIVSIVVIITGLLRELAFRVTAWGDINDPLVYIITLVNGSIYWIFVFIGVIIALFWYHGATKNIHSFGAKRTTTPNMAVISWFIPLFNLWKPNRYTQQIWKASNPEIVITSGTEWKNSANSNLIKFWWLLVLVSVIGILAGGFINGYRIETYGLEQANDPTLRFLEIIFNIILIISMIFFIPMIKKISTKQEIKSGLAS